MIRRIRGMLGPSARSRSYASRWRLHELWFSSPLYRLTLVGRPPRRLARLAPEPWPGDASRGRAILAGKLVCAGQAIDAQRPDWYAAGVRPLALIELHGFGWLDDLAAEGSPDARQRARHLIADWLDNDKRWRPIVWAPEVLGRRVSAWLTHAPFLARGEGDPLGPRLLASLAQQLKHLVRVAARGRAGSFRLEALKGMIVGAATGVGRDGDMRKALRLIERELAQQLLVDGGHIERSPSAHLRALMALIDIRAMLQAAGSSVPNALETAIERMAPVLRFLRHGDGGLALFNDSNEEPAALIDLALTRAGAKARPPTSLPDSGFERLLADRALVIVDSGAPPPRGYDRYAHAGTLSFEMSVGKERLIVNCGAHPSSDPGWRRAQRYTAAHSTLILDDTNSAEVEADGGLGRRPVKVECAREESDGNSWLTMSHDGYVATHGLIHRRRLYLAHDGADLRGEDTLLGGGRSGVYDLRFHLHPEVQASVIQNGAAALLKLPSGAAWRLQVAGGQLQIAESIYLGRRSEPRRSEQLIVHGGFDGAKGTAIKWALKRVAKT
ncbi:MAG TPA: heparinase II/III family protein [Alphaproteobacteria bacterium]|nr:heparinase II/III family protein [Alphaproteobacteria bacterium]